jgi:hypothetical protein
LLFLVNREWAFYPPRLGSARIGAAGGSSDTCYPSIPLQLPGASASSPPASPKMTMSQEVLAMFGPMMSIRISDAGESLIFRTVGIDGRRSGGREVHILR